MFELLPEVGLRLPGRAGTLRFGMEERTAQWAVATVADVRDGWVCGARWAFSARYRGLTLDAYGDTTDRRGRHQDAPGLAGIALTRDPFTLSGPSACPVVLGGINLFGYPTAEVSDALSGSLHPTLRLSGDGLYLTAVSVHGEPVPVESGSRRRAGSTRPSTRRRPRPELDHLDKAPWDASGPPRPSSR